MRSRDENEQMERGLSGDFPGGLVVMNLPRNAGATGSVPGWDNWVNTPGLTGPNEVMEVRVFG